MIGEKLSDILSRQKDSLPEIARRLGMSHQSLRQARDAADIKIGLLERIAEALGVPMTFFYPAEGQNAMANGDDSVAGSNNVVGSITIGDSARLKERVTMLEQLLDERNKLIDEKERLIKV